MVLIPLGGKAAAGRHTKVDSDVAEELMKLSWYWESNGYARRAVRFRMPDGRRAIRHIYMHREVWCLAGKVIPDGHELDHINGDKLDNRLYNLRPATTAQNQHNRKLNRKVGTSRYKGVSWYKPTGKWRARIQHNGKEIYLGYFADEIEATKAYDKAARQLFGEYARCNFPVEKEINNV